MRRWFVLAFLAALAGSSGAGRAAAASDPPLLLGNPTVSRTEIAFTYGGDIWIVSRRGGEAPGAGLESGVMEQSREGA